MSDNTKIRKIIKTTLNEWLNEQYKYDELKLNNLVSIISKKYPEINYGGCAVFARVFHNVTGLPYMLIIDDGLLDEDPPIHVMIKLPNGKLFDGEGIRTKQQVKEYYKYDLEGKLLFLQDNDGSILGNYYEELGSGLFTHCHKEHYDDILSIIKSAVGNF